MPLHVGDTAPPFSAICTSAGVPVSLTGADVTVHLRKPDGTPTAMDATGADDGSVAADWPAPLDQEGVWTAEVQVTRGNQVQTFGPDTFFVAAQLG